MSSFNPLVAEVAERCLSRHYGSPPPAESSVPSHQPSTEPAADETNATDTTDTTHTPHTTDQETTRSARALRTAVLLASHGWDRATSAELTSAVETARRVQPLLFFQSNPNAVLGHVAARWKLGGPVVCLGAPPGSGPPGQDRLLAEAMAEAALVIGDGDADEALVIVAEQASTPEQLDSAVAVLVTPCAPQVQWRSVAEPGARMTVKGRTP